MSNVLMIPHGPCPIPHSVPGRLNSLVRQFSVQISGHKCQGLHGPGQITCPCRRFWRAFDKRHDFDFHIVNFPFLSSNIPSGPSYGVYISQLIRYARCCSHYDDFRYRHKYLVDRLLSQGYKALRLEKSFKKFYGRYQDLIEKYRRSVNAMVSDSFPGQFLFNM